MDRRSQEIKQLLEENKKISEIGKILSSKGILFVKLQKEINSQTENFREAVCEDMWNSLKVLLLHYSKNKKDKNAIYRARILENNLRRRILWAQKKYPSFSMNLSSLKNRFLGSLH